LLPSAATQATPAKAPVVYVALGDSFSAGAGIQPQSGGDTGTICLQSAVNYPHLVAKALGAVRFTDVTCGAATSRNLTGTQFDVSGPARPPQFDALTSDTTLVTLGIGGNDIGLVELAASCINPLPEPLGRSCAAANNAGGRDLVGQRIRAFVPTYAAILREIHRRAPRARTLLVGYPTAIRRNGCPGVQPAWPADADYVQAKIDQLNGVMAAQAAAHGVTFVSLTEATRGHDACADLDRRWMVGVVPASADAPIPLHPNAAGHRNTARQVLAALSQ
jgi:lysophospholipase L1-like esterase